MGKWFDFKYSDLPYVWKIEMVQILINWLVFHLPYKGDIKRVVRTYVIIACATCKSNYGV